LDFTGFEAAYYVDFVFAGNDVEYYGIPLGLC
jgi:hypothetical protein